MGFRVAVVAVSMSMMSGPTIAQNSMTFAMELGRALAYEQACNLTYDQDAIARLVQERVAADDVQFNGTVALAVTSRTRELGDQTQSTLTVYCTQIEQMAREFDFIE